MSLFTGRGGLCFTVPRKERVILRLVGSPLFSVVLIICGLPHAISGPLPPIIGYELAVMVTSHVLLLLLRSVSEWLIVWPLRSGSPFYAYTVCRYIHVCVVALYIHTHSVSLPPSLFLPFPPLSLSPLHTAWKNGWQVISPKKSFAVFAATPTEKAEWMAHINKCIVDLLAKSEFSSQLKFQLTIRGSSSVLSIGVWLTEHDTFCTDMHDT